jgi:hypothetical protein
MAREAIPLEPLVRHFYNETGRCAMRKATSTRTRTSAVTKRSRKTVSKNKLKAASRRKLIVMGALESMPTEISAQKEIFLKNLSTLSRLY